MDEKAGEDQKRQKGRDQSAEPEIQSPPGRKKRRFRKKQQENEDSKKKKSKKTLFHKESLFCFLKIYVRPS